jgi:Kef-type K+ transport system membrane component KefB
VDLAGLASIEAVGLLLGVTLLAVVAKFAGAFLGSIDRGRARAVAIGWGMVPRGEVGIVVAGLGLTTGAIDGQLYSVVVGMAVLSTLIVPPLLPYLLDRAEPERRRLEPSRDDEELAAPPA